MTRHLTLAVLLSICAVATRPLLGQNVVRNGGFDTDLSSWTISKSATGLITYSALDANGASNSGSARLGCTGCSAVRLTQPVAFSLFDVNKFVRFSAKAFIPADQTGRVSAVIGSYGGDMLTTVKGAWTPIAYVYQLPSYANSGVIMTSVELTVTGDSGASPLAYFDDVRTEFVARESLCPSNCSAVASPTGMKGEPVLFSGTASSGCGSQLMYEWDFGDYWRLYGLSETALNTTHSYEFGGKYAWTFVVIGPDTTPCVQSGELSVGFKGCAPITAYPMQSWSGGTSGCGPGANCQVNEPITFFVQPPVQASDCPEPPVSWLFSDGVQASGIRVTRQFAKPGRYDVKMTIGREPEAYWHSIPMTVTTAPNRRRVVGR